MDGGYHVDPGQLRAHARHVDELASKANTAVDAARQVTPGGWDNAYGVICQFFPALLRPIAHRAMDTTTRAAQGFGHAADKLTATAETYEDNDRGISDRFDGLHDDGVRPPELPTVDPPARPR